MIKIIFSNYQSLKWSARDYRLLSRKAIFTTSTSNDFEYEPKLYERSTRSRILRIAKQNNISQLRCFSLVFSIFQLTVT